MKIKIQSVIWYFKILIPDDEAFIVVWSIAFFQITTRIFTIFLQTSNTIELHIYMCILLFKNFISRGNWSLEDDENIFLRKVIIISIFLSLKKKRKERKEYPIGGRESKNTRTRRSHATVKRAAKSKQQSRHQDYTLSLQIPWIWKRKKILASERTRESFVTKTRENSRAYPHIRTYTRFWWQTGDKKKACCHEASLKNILLRIITRTWWITHLLSFFSRFY